MSQNLTQHQNLNRSPVVARVATDPDMVAVWFQRALDVADRVFAFYVVKKTGSSDPVEALTRFLSPREGRER